MNAGGAKMTEGGKKEVTSCSAGNHFTPNPFRTQPGQMCFPAQPLVISEPPVKRKYNCPRSERESTFTLAPLPLPPKLIPREGPAKEPESERQRLQ